METPNQIAKRLRDVLVDGHWIANTNYKELLADLTWEEATKTFGQHNSIALLTFHVNYYLEGLLHAFETGELVIKDKFSFDLPALQSDKEWTTMVAKFNSNALAFVKAVEVMSPEQLDSLFIIEKYGTYRRNIEGVIEHSYYHMGQIAMIKKLLKTKTTS